MGLLIFENIRRKYRDWSLRWYLNWQWIRKSLILMREDDRVKKMVKDMIKDRVVQFYYRSKKKMFKNNDRKK